MPSIDTANVDYWPGATLSNTQLNTLVRSPATQYPETMPTERREKDTILKDMQVQFYNFYVYNMTVTYANTPYQSHAAFKGSMPQFPTSLHGYNTNMNPIVVVSPDFVYEGNILDELAEAKEPLSFTAYKDPTQRYAFLNKDVIDSTSFPYDIVTANTSDTDEPAKPTHNWASARGVTALHPASMIYIQADIMSVRNGSYAELHRKPDAEYYLAPNRLYSAKYSVLKPFKAHLSYSTQCFINKIMDTIRTRPDGENVKPEQVNGEDVKVEPGIAEDEPDDALMDTFIDIFSLADDNKLYFGSKPTHRNEILFSVTQVVPISDEGNTIYEYDTLAGRSITQLTGVNYELDYIEKDLRDKDNLLGRVVRKPFNNLKDMHCAAFGFSKDHMLRHFHSSHMRGSYSSLNFSMTPQGISVSNLTTMPGSDAMLISKPKLVALQCNKFTIPMYPLDITSEAALAYYRLKLRPLYVSYEAGIPEEEQTWISTVHPAIFFRFRIMRSGKWVQRRPRSCTHAKCRPGRQSTIWAEHQSQLPTFSTTLCWVD